MSALNPAVSTFDLQITADRQTLLANGYEPLPLNGKAPHITSWSSKEITTHSINAWARDREHQDSINTGIRCGHVVGIDVDALDEATAANIEQLVRSLPDGERALKRVGKAPKALY